MGQKPTRSVTAHLSKVFCFAGPFTGAYPIGEKIEPSKKRHPRDLLTLSRRAGSPRDYPIEPAKWSCYYFGPFWAYTVPTARLLLCSF